jgi:hypothetical protein
LLLLGWLVERRLPAAFFKGEWGLGLSLGLSFGLRLGVGFGLGLGLGWGFDFYGCGFKPAIKLA